MSKVLPNTADNTFYQARLKAAKTNESFKNRDNVADLLLITPGRMYKIEQGLMNPTTEEVYQMADLYNAPELKSYYCEELCPLGCKHPKTEVESFDRIVLGVVTGLPKLEKAKDILLAVTEDGKVESSELADVKAALEVLNKFRKSAQNYELWLEKHVGEDFKSVSSSEV